MAIAYTQALLDRAQAYTQQPLAARRREGMSELASLYSAITGEAVGKCQQCQYSDFMAVVTNYIRSATRFLHPETMSDSKYTIAPGLENETFVHEAYDKAVTAENLEDADVAFFKKHGMGDSFVLKDSKAAAADDSEKDSKDSKAAEKAKDALATEKTAHKATKDALKAEKERTATLTEQVEQLRTQLDKATAGPEAPVVDPATAS